MLLQDYRPGDRLVGFFAVRRLARREHNGRPYLTMNLADKTAAVNAVMWEGFETIVDRLRPGVVVKIQGMMSEYRDQPQIRLEHIRLAVDHEYDLTQLLPVSPVPPEKLASRLDEIVNSITDPHLRRMMEIIFADDQTRERFLSSPGGQRWHHAFVGGLAEHTFSVVDVCEFCARHYPELDRDLLICGAVLHDIGKIEQYSTSTVFEYTDAGRLLGHIVEGDEIVRTAIRRVEGFPREKEMLLRHLILAHHGQLGQASPVVPQTREAFILYYADDLDAKMGALRRIAEKTGDEAWSEYVKLIDRFIYYGRAEEPSEEIAPADQKRAANGEE